MQNCEATCDELAQPEFRPTSSMHVSSEAIVHRIIMLAGEFAMSLWSQNSTNLVRTIYYHIIVAVK